ncbi:hypothetical protein WAI93_19295, partial [Acinetobacter baumannii]
MHNPEFKEIAAIWFFSPFVVILFTTFMFESLNRKMTNQLKQLSVIDFLLRCTILLINFLGVSGIIYLTFNHLILLGIIFMTVNVYLEWRMYKKLLLLNLQNKKTDEAPLTRREIDDLCEDYAKEQSILRDKSPNEKEEIRSIYKSTFFVGCSYALILLLIV